MTSYPFLMGIIFFVVNLFVYCTTMMPQLLYGPSGWEIRAGRGPATFVYQDSGRAAMNSPKQEHIHYDGGPYRGKRRGSYKRGRQKRSANSLKRDIKACQKICRDAGKKDQRDAFRTPTPGIGGLANENHRAFDDTDSRFFAKVSQCKKECLDDRASSTKRRSRSRSVSW